MPICIQILLVIFLFSMADAFRISGWWVGPINTPNFPIEKLSWNIYTHIRYGDPPSFPNGTVYCDKDDRNLNKVLYLGKKYNTKILWGAGAPPHILWNASNIVLKNNYLNSIGNAVKECGLDGIEIDYEFGDSPYISLGIVTPKESTHYTTFLSQIKESLGTSKIVAADISIWGIGHGEWILGFWSWVNATMLNHGRLDYINTMSYHWSSSGNIWAWEKDEFFLDAWGMNRNRVNIGLPWYSNKWYDTPSSEPTWNSLSPYCPNINPSLNICNNTVFIGKKMNKRLGYWIKSQGFGGVFPWAANYDSLQYNNSLLPWLVQGLHT